MKRYILILSAMIGLLPIASAQGTVEGVKVNGLKMERNGKYMLVDMNVDFTELKVESNRAIVLTPVIVNGSDSLELNSVGIYGRSRYYHYMRSGGVITGETEKSYRASEKPEVMNYHSIVPYEKWMNGSQLYLSRKDYGCCKSLVAQQSGVLIPDFSIPVMNFVPEFVYVRPKAEEKKTRSLSGKAYVDFPVSKTAIYPDYRKNPQELAKIQATIDSVKSDKDYTITALSIKGYASPESSYANNTRLAKGRTEALKAYVESMYNFGDGFIKTSYEPEDWAGLREYVEKSNLANKDAILDIIDGNLDYDAKERLIKSKYPADYRFLLDNCYPALRHSDYMINYEVRHFSDVNEIKRIMKENPQKLSLNEFYLAAESCESGSEEFNHIFDVAVRMYPNDQVANLNEANTSMARGDMVSAKRFLAKAGNGAEAVYARGLYAALNKDYVEAEKNFIEAQRLGVKQAESALEQLKKVKEYNAEIE